jgi:hypothetical protein
MSFGRAGVRSNPLFDEEIASAEEHRLAMTKKPVIY